jgi:ABC-2 type transport system permease protein
MGFWAEEKKNGTDELLLTLPAGDLGIALGKYAGALAIYTVALLFSLSHVVVLSWLGSPDPGLIASTYLGYWLMGAALISLAMIGSLLTGNLTIAFIVGCLLCAIPVFIDHAGVIASGRLERFLASFSFREQFRDLSTGVVTLSSVSYFVSFTVAMLYLNVALLGRRHWPTARKAAHLGRHTFVRALALVVVVVSLTVLLDRVGERFDVTAERIHSLSDDTRRLIGSLDPARPVFVYAYLSPDVPRAYLEARSNIVSMLREFTALGRGRIHARLIETEKYTPAAREAQERYNIRAQDVPPAYESIGSPRDIFLGLAFACGGEEFVIPFFDPGLPVEYELMRSIRVVSRAERRKVGILETSAKLFGGFNFESRSQSNDWSIVAELRKQYDVVQVPAAQEYPADLDVLIAVLPHTLEPEPLGRLVEYVKKGRPVLALLDPLPAFNLELSPQELPANPFGPAPPAKKSFDVSPLTAALGVDWPKDRVVWDKYNPHPQFRSLQPEVIFVGPGSKAAAPFNPKEPVSSGLQELVLIYSGILKPGPGAGSAFRPLLETGPDSGVTSWSRLVQPSFFGVQLVTGQVHEPDKETHVLAARVNGKVSGNAVDAIVVADADMMGEQFFQLRRQGVANLNFDNVTFLLNAVDQLAGDESFIALRKRRPRHRTLEAVEARTKVYEEQRLKDTQEAERVAEQQLNEAQARLDRAVDQLRKRADLDEQTRRIMIANQEKIENRRLAVARSSIEDEKQRKIERSRSEMEGSIRRIQNTIKVLAVALPPIPAFLLFLLVSFRRLRRERMRIPADRLVPEAALRVVKL